MSDVPDNNLLLTAGGDEKQLAEVDEVGWFEPFIPSVPVPLAPKPAPEPEPPSFMPISDEVLRDCGFDFTPTDTIPETAPPASAADVDTGAAETAPHSEIPAASAAAPIPPPPGPPAPPGFTRV